MAFEAVINGGTIMKLIFLGPPGAGKGTQAQRLMVDLDIPQISTGDILRKAIREMTPTGVIAKGYIDRGELVPDDVVIAIVRERLQEKDCEKGYILDGFPRTVPQAEVLDTIVTMDAVVDFELPNEEIINRLSGRRVCPGCNSTYHVSRLEGDTCPACGEKVIQRKDDMPETVLNRLEVYEKQTAPLIAYYKEKDLLRVVNCQGCQVEEVYAKVKKVLGINA